MPQYLGHLAYITILGVQLDRIILAETMRGGVALEPVCLCRPLDLGPYCLSGDVGTRLAAGESPLWPSLSQDGRQKRRRDIYPSALACLTLRHPTATG